jgi:hypothetical protein
MVSDSDVEILPVEQKRRVRLKAVEVAPFRRAQRIEHASVYWIGGFKFPMPFRVRQWFLTFVTRLKAVMAVDGLRQENFLRFKVVAREQTDRFLQTSREYKPLAGFAIPPGPICARQTCRTHRHRRGLPR